MDDATRSVITRVQAWASPPKGNLTPVIDLGDIRKLLSLAEDMERVERAQAADQARRTQNARRWEQAHGHDADCIFHAQAEPCPEHCNCIVADIDRGCMGDVVHALERARALADARNIKARDRTLEAEEATAHVVTTLALIERMKTLAGDVVEFAYLPCDQTLQCGCCGAIWWDVEEDIDENWHAEGCELFAVEVALGKSRDVRKGPAPERHSAWADPTNGGKAREIRANYKAALSSVDQLRADLERSDGEKQQLVTERDDAVARVEEIERIARTLLTELADRDVNGAGFSVRAGQREIEARIALEEALR